MKKIFLIIILVSVINADKIYFRDATVYENCKLVEKNKMVVKVKLFKNNIKQLSIPKILIQKIIQSDPDTLKKSVFYASRLASTLNLASSSDFKSEIKKMNKEVKKIAEKKAEIEKQRSIKGLNKRVYYLEWLAGALLGIILATLLH